MTALSAFSRRHRYRRFQAFLMYLYTDAIEFAPFRSERNRIDNPPEAKVSSSPKSIYRFADKACSRDALVTHSLHPGPDKVSLQYNVPALKTLALNRIRDELPKCDIIEEAFGRFASK